MALAALLSSLALLASAPSQVVLAQADAPPPPAAEAQAPITHDDSNLQANADALANGQDTFPAGAPTDDYGLMAWCYGALAGHMDLYDRVLPEVRRIESQFPDSNRPLDLVMDDYKTQHEAGAKILDDYGRALSLEEAEHSRGQNRAAAVGKGREVWKGSDLADPRQLAQLWMSWALPDRCESTADRLVRHKAAR